MKNLIKLSRELVENLLSGNKKKLGKEYFFIFSISKFILLKERILKKDSANNILHFNNTKNAKYIPAILAFAEEIKKNGTYQFNSTTIKLEKNNNDSQKLDEALWIFNKVRDSLAHGQYTIDLENDSLLINNDHSNEVNNAYKLVCSIPIQLLNSISFYIEEINEKTNEKDLSIAYRKYLEKVAANYDINTKKLFGNNYIININKYYNNKLNIDNYKNYNNYYIDNNKYYNNTYNIDNNYLNNTIKDNFESKIQPQKREKDFVSTDDIADRKIKIILNNLTIEELYRLVKLLLEYKPSSEKQKEQIQQILKKFKLLVEQRIKLEEQKIFDTKSSELMSEISDILGIKVGAKNSDVAITLYTYMNLVLSQNNEIDYSHICLRNLILDFDPYKNGQGTGKVYSDTINYINKLCTEFSEKMGAKIEAYYDNPSEIFRHSLMGIYAEFYTSIMNSIGNRNKLVLTSIRNSIEHGNYYVNKNGSLILYDQTDHNDNNSIKFLCGSFPRQLFDITKSIELGNAKDKYIMDDFFKELETIVDDTTLTKIMNTMNSFSKIIFGKDIDTKNSMEHMYQEAIANVITQHISKK